MRWDTSLSVLQERLMDFNTFLCPENIFMENFHPFTSQRLEYFHCSDIQVRSTPIPEPGWKDLFLDCAWQRRLITDVIAKMPLGSCDTVIMKKNVVTLRRNNQPDSQVDSVTPVREEVHLPLPLSLSISWMQNYRGRAIISRPSVPKTECIMVLLGGIRPIVHITPLMLRLQLCSRIR